MKKTISIALVLMIAVFSLTACSAEAKTYKDAVSAYDAGDYQKAVELLTLFLIMLTLKTYANKQQQESISILLSNR